MNTSLSDEQAAYLAEGAARRAEVYGFESEPEGGHLTLALAWWAAYWRDQANRAHARRLAGAQVGFELDVDGA